MTSRLLTVAAMALAISVPALAQNQTTTPAALEQIQLAATFARYGEARQDPILMLAAAKIAKEVSNEGAPAAASLPSMESMLAHATEYADGDPALTSQINELQSAAPKAYCYGPYGVGWC